MRKIEWAEDGINSLNEILEYYKRNAGENVADNIYEKIINEVELLEMENVRTKQTQELMDIGIHGVYELLINPWKVYYKISDDNKFAYVLFVLDVRRNLEEILMSKVINHQI